MHISLTPEEYLVKKRMKLDADEKKLLPSVDRGEWKSCGGGSASEPTTRGTEVDVPEESAAEHWLPISKICPKDREPPNGERVSPNQFSDERRLPRTDPSNLGEGRHVSADDAFNGSKAIEKSRRERGTNARKSLEHEQPP